MNILIKTRSNRRIEIENSSLNLILFIGNNKTLKGTKMGAGGNRKFITYKNIHQRRKMSRN